MKLDARKLRLLAVLCPILSVAVAAGSVTFEYVSLASVNRRLAQGEREIDVLQARLAHLTKGTQVFTPTKHDHEAGHED